jgi:hypothetical protein
MGKDYARDGKVYQEESTAGGGCLRVIAVPAMGVSLIALIWGRR